MAELIVNFKFNAIGIDLEIKEIEKEVELLIERRINEVVSRRLSIYDFKKQHGKETN